MLLSVLALCAASAEGLAAGGDWSARPCSTRRAAGALLGKPSMRLQRSSVVSGAFACALSGALLSPAALAVSGGGKDFSGQSLEGEDLSGKSFRGKEFRGIRGANARFVKTDLSSTSFFKADLTGADLTGANLQGASLEETGLDGAVLDDAVLESAYLTKTIDTAKSIRGADFSDAVMPTYTQRALCERPDAIGTNSKTGVPTRDSLMCP